MFEGQAREEETVTAPSETWAQASRLPLCGEDATHASPTFDDKRKQSSLAKSPRHVSHRVSSLDSFLNILESRSPSPSKVPNTNHLQPLDDSNRGPADQTTKTQDDAPCPWPKPLLHQCASSLPRICTIPSPSRGFFATLKTRSTTMLLCSPTSTRPKSSRAMRRRARTSWSSASCPRPLRALQKAS